MEAAYEISDTGYIMTFWLSYCARAVEDTVTAFLLWIGLSINEKVYRKICGKCHLRIMTLCDNGTQTTFKKKSDKGYHLMMNEME